MNLRQILARIDMVRDEAGLTDRALSLRATGSTDTVRNWRRKTDVLLPGGAQTESLGKIARALGVREEWLIYGTGARTAGAVGFSDAEVEPWHMPDRNGNMNLPELLAPGLRHRQLWRVRQHSAWLALRQGDILLIEGNGEARCGETVIAQIGVEAEAVTRLALYAPPWLMLDGGTRPFPEGDAAILGIVRAVARSDALHDDTEPPLPLATAD